MRDLLRVVHDLCAIPETDDDTPELCARVQDVLDDHEITPVEFRELDERPGRWGYVIDGLEWHYKLRRYRNNRKV